MVAMRSRYGRGGVQTVSKASQVVSIVSSAVPSPSLSISIRTFSASMTISLADEFSPSTSKVPVCGYEPS